MSIGLANNITLHAQRDNYYAVEPRLTSTPQRWTLAIQWTFPNVRTISP